MTRDEIEQRIDYLEGVLNSLNNRFEVCATDHVDLLGYNAMEEELTELRSQLDNVE